VGPVDVEIAGEVGTGTNPIGGTMNPQLGSVGARVGVVYRHVYVGVDYLEAFAGSVDYGDVTLGDTKSHAFGAPPTSALYLEPGVCVLGLIGHVILGADANVLIQSLGGTEPALTFHLQAGVRF